MTSRRPCVANIAPRSSTLQRHVCLQLFKADVWLGPEAPEEAFIVFKVGYRSFTSTTVRRDPNGVYSWGSGLHVENESEDPGNASLHEWTLESGQAMRCQVMQAHVFAPRPNCPVEEDGAAQSGHAIEDGSHDESGSAEFTRKLEACAESCDDTHDLGRRLGRFDVSLFALKEQGGVQSVTGGRLLHSGKAVNAPQASKPGVAPAESQQRGSLALHVTLQNRDGFLQESGNLAQRTDDYLQLLDCLTAAPDQEAAQDLRGSREKIGSATTASMKAKIRLLNQNTSLRAIVADQQGHIDALKELVSGSPSAMVRHARPVSLPANYAPTGRLPVSCPSHRRRPRGSCARSASASASAALRPSRGSSMPLSQGMPSRSHGCRARMASPELSRPHSGPALMQFSSPESTSASNSEVHRFLREHAHQRQELEPLILRHLSKPDVSLPVQSVGEPRPHESQPRFRQDVPATYSAHHPVTASSASKAPCPAAVNSRTACRGAAAVIAESEVRRAVLRHFATPWHAFKALDLDSDGLLSLAEFRRAFELACPDTSEEMTRRFWQRAGGHGDGYITADQLAEFLVHGS